MSTTVKINTDIENSNIKHTVFRRTLPVDIKDLREKRSAGYIVIAFQSSAH